MSRRLTTTYALGDFTFEDHVATGGMGEVWRGRHVSTGAPVAIKLLTARYAALPDFQRRFRREVQATSRLRDPRIVRLYDYGFTPPDAPTPLPRSAPYYVMEWAEEGAAAGDRMPADWASVSALLVDVLGALAHSHARGILHRDIKPDNVLYVVRDGALRHALTDFGIAHALERNAATDSEDLTGRSAEEASGTPTFMAPEQFLGQWRDYGPWTDLYAVGILAWRLICGRMPFAGTTFWELAQAHLERALPALDPAFEVPDEADAWVAALAAKSPRSRPQCAADALRTLQSFAPMSAPRHISAHPTSVRPGAGLIGLAVPALVGRATERQRVQDAFEAVRADGRTRAIVLRGPAGSGKSRLARSIIEDAVEHGHAVGFEATHQPDEGTRHGLGYMLSRHWRCGGLDVTEAMKRLLVLLGDHPDVEDREPAMLAELVSESGTEPTTSLRRDQRFELVRRAIAREIQGRTGIVLLDDVQWDADALEFARVLLDDSANVLVLLTAREEDLSADLLARLEHLQDKEGVDELAVRYLDLNTMQTLVRHELGIGGAAARAIEDHAQGSPLFAVQLAEHWLHEGLLEQVDDAWQFAANRPLLPPDLLGLWTSRVDRIVEQYATARDLGAYGLRLPVPAEAVRDRIELAATLGAEVDTREWDAACAAAGIREVPFLAEELQERGLIVADEEGFRFTHALLRDALLSSSRERQRSRPFNLAAARALTSLHPATHPDLARRVARHFADAGVPQLALTCLEEALGHVKRRLEAEQYGELAQLTDRTLESLGAPPDDPRRISARGHCAVPLVLSAQAEEVEEAREVLADTERDARSSGSATALCDVLTIAGWASIHLGDKHGGVEKLEEALAIAPDPDARGLALTFMAHVQSHLRNYEAAARWAGELLANHDVPAWRVRAHEVLAHNALEAHDPGTAEEQLREALRCAELGGTPQLLGHLNNLLGFVADFREDFATAESRHRQALALIRLFAPRSAGVNATHEYLARAILQQGRVDEAYRELMELRERELAGQRGLYMHLEDALFACAAAQGRMDDAADLLEAAFAFDRGFTPNALHSRALIFAARAFAGHGAHAQARTVYERTAALIADSDELQHHLATIQRELASLPAT